MSNAPGAAPPENLGIGTEAQQLARLAHAAEVHGDGLGVVFSPPNFKTLQGVGLSQCAMLCPEVCAGPWWCGLCNDFHSDALGKHTKHSDWCNTAHPEVRAAWEKNNDHAMMKLAAMVGARGHFLPAFLMNMLFPGFPHADPLGYPRAGVALPNLGPAPQTSDDPTTR